MVVRLRRQGIRRANGCFEWQGAKNSSGYGAVRYKGNSVGVHRLLWKLVRGTIPKGMLICHKCDNPACFELRHLFMGSNLDNRLDAVRKGRARGLRGERNPNSVVRDWQLRLARKEIRSHKALRSVARSMNLHPATLWSALHRNY